MTPEFTQRLIDYEQFLKQFGYEKVVHCEGCVHHNNEYCGLHREYVYKGYYCGSGKRRDGKDK